MSDLAWTFRWRLLGRGGTVELMPGEHLALSVPGHFAHTSVTQFCEEMYSLAGVPQLRGLDLRGCDSFTPGAAEAVGSVEQVRALDCGETNLSHATIPELHELRALTILDLSDCPSLDQEGLRDVAAQWPSLEALALTNDEVTATGLAPFAGRPLHELRLGGTALSQDALNVVGSLAELERLTLTAPAATDLTPLAGCQLKELILGSCATDSMLRGLTMCGGLEFLDVGASAVTDAGVASIACLAGLRELRVNGCRGITDAGMAHVSGLSRLEHLSIAATRVSGRGLLDLEALANLETLRAFGTRVDAASARKLEQHIPGIDILLR